MTRFVRIMILAVVGSLLVWQVPLFHVVSIDALRARQQTAELDAAELAEKLWNDELASRLESAADAAALVTAIRANPQQAREQFGRTVGLSRAYYYLFRGRGSVVGVDPQGVGVALDETAAEPDFVLTTGLLFGNTVRDATALAEAGDFADSQRFNHLSTELNRIVENRVIPVLKDRAEVGRRIEFAGCAVVRDEAHDLRPLQVVPLKVTFPE